MYKNTIIEFVFFVISRIIKVSPCKCYSPLIILDIKRNLTQQLFKSGACKHRKFKREGKSCEPEIKLAGTLLILSQILCWVPTSPFACTQNPVGRLKQRRFRKRYPVAFSVDERACLYIWEPFFFSYFQRD